MRILGQVQEEVLAAVVRPLLADDLGALEERRGSTTPALARITNRHHMLARILAGGATDYDASAVTGYTPSSISILKNDPAFKELLNHYAKMVTESYMDMHAKLATLAADAADTLADRLESKPDSISTSTLLEVVKMGADRTGFGPASKSTQVNIHVDMADRLEAARQRLAERRKIVEVAPLDVLPE